MLVPEDGKNPDQQAEQDDGDEQDAIARHALFIAHRAQTLDAAGGEVIHQFGIGGGGPAKMVLEALHQRGEVILPHPKIIVMLRRADGFALRLEAVLVHLFENRLAWRGGGRRLNRGRL
jgi:hypothetical protein